MINRLLYADGFVLVESSEQGLLHALYRFSAACDQAGMKIKSKVTETIFHSIITSQCTLYAPCTVVGGEVQAPCGGILE